MSDGNNEQVIRFPGPRKALGEKNTEPAPVKPEPDVIEAGFVDDKPVQPVDQPHKPADVPRWHQEVTRKPILYRALHRDQFRQAARYYLGDIGHRVRFHGIRLPEYALRIVMYAPRGTWRIAGVITSWVTVAEMKSLKNTAVRHDDHANYLRHERVQAPKAHARRIVLAVMLIATVAGGVAMWLFAPGWALLLAALAVVDLLGYMGRPADRPLIGTAVVPEQYVKLTSDIVVRALSSTGIPALAAKDAVITFPAPIQRDGDGWRAEIDLPHGTTATEVIKARPKLASGLRRPLGCVWPEGDPSVHEGRLILWCGDKDWARKGYVRWPLTNRGRHDFFDRMPFGEEPRGRLITVPLFQHNVLIGALPGQGKTAAVRCLTAGLALDPTVELWVHELAGKGDLDAFEKVAHRFVSGIDEGSIAYAALSLRMLRAEVERRTEALKLVPEGMRPDKRITRDIADKRSFRLWPLAAIFDEVQHLFEHPDYGKQAGEDAAHVIRLGRAVGLVLILATQRPDKDSLPTRVSGNVSLRIALYVPGQVENDMILGTSSYQNGLRATSPNLRPEIDAGIGILKGATPIPLIVKGAYLNGPTTERVTLRARAMREAAGTLSGVAAGEAEEQATEVASLLDDLNVVYVKAERTDRAGVWSEELCAGLAELRPEVYGGWTPETLAAALRPYAVRTVQLHMPDDTGTRRTRYGLRRELLTQALAIRAERRKLESS